MYSSVWRSESAIEGRQDEVGGSTTKPGERHRIHFLLQRSAFAMGATSVPSALRALCVCIILASICLANASLGLYNSQNRRSMASAASVEQTAVSAPNEKLPQMWEISTRPWLYSLSQKYNSNITKLSQIPVQEFINIRNKGMDIVWLMGLWQLGTRSPFLLLRTNHTHIYLYADARMRCIEAAPSTVLAELSDSFAFRFSSANPL